MTRADLEAMDRLVKDMSQPVAEVRREVLRQKKSTPFSEVVIQLNPKIDPSQRRLQCSISFVRLYKTLAPGVDRRRTENPQVFGVKFSHIRAAERRKLLR